MTEEGNNIAEMTEVCFKDTDKSKDTEHYSIKERFQEVMDYVKKMKNVGMDYMKKKMKEVMYYMKKEVTTKTEESEEEEEEEMTGARNHDMTKK
eukprot:1377181-Heterocapsa_arctica.AAC.1